MFWNAQAINQDLSGWDVSTVTNMRSMFLQAETFNQDLSGWDVSSVTTMQAMFSVAFLFNQDISMWDVSSATSMSGMFEGADAMTFDLCWDVTNVPVDHVVAPIYNQTAPGAPCN